jgi:hypothetical protein
MYVSSECSETLCNWELSIRPHRNRDTSVGRHKRATGAEKCDATWPKMLAQQQSTFSDFSRTYAATQHQLSCCKSLLIPP